MSACCSSAGPTWDPALFCVLLVLAVAGELTAIEVDRPRLRISSGFTAIIVAAVFLGASTAALIGVLTVLADWAWNRFPRQDLLINLVAYAIYPLVAGTLFHEAVAAVGDLADGWRLLPVRSSPSSSAPS